MDLAENLHYDFNYNLYLAKSMLSNLENVSDRYKALMWMKTLSACNRSLTQMKLRNEFLKYLVLNIRYRILRPPFENIPPTNHLAPLANLIPAGLERHMHSGGLNERQLKRTRRDNNSLLYESVDKKELQLVAPTRRLKRREFAAHR